MTKNSKHTLDIFNQEDYLNFIDQEAMNIIDAVSIGRTEDPSLPQLE